MQQRPKSAGKHSFRPLLFAPPRGADALPPTVRPSGIKGHAGESHVRLKAMPMRELDQIAAEAMLDELCEEQLALGVALGSLEAALDAAPRDVSARAALTTLAQRLVDLTAVRDALASLQISAVDPRLKRLFDADAPLADYLRGVYAWVHALVRAFEDLATSLRTLTPDWALLRWRIEEANNFHFDDAQDSIRREVAQLAAVPGADQVDRALEGLFEAAINLESRLDERFG